jgi:thiol-disulfide isomerase/thioredoxin
MFFSKYKPNMEKPYKKYLVPAIRIIIFGLFILSAVAKMFPLWAFEKQLVDLGITDWCGSHYMARIILGIEIAAGIAILQNHFIKRLVLPATALLLIAFCVHLGIQIAQHGATSGNCGCFGQLIPMTPLEALIKNILTLGLLWYLYKNVNEAEGNKITIPLLILVLSELIVFLFFPFGPCDSDSNKASGNKEGCCIQMEARIKTLEARLDSLTGVTLQDTGNSQKGKSETDSKEVKKEEAGPKAVVSKFSSFTSFSGQTVNLDKGKAIVCMFAPGCDHCMATAKELNQMSKSAGFPPVYILFMDEEANKIPEFFKFAGRSFPYQVIDIPKFWKTMGPGGGTPGVYYLWNGNLIKSFEGTEDKKFDKNQLLKSLGSK